MTISMLATIEALRHPNGHIVIVAPTDRQAGELFMKIAWAFTNSGLKEFLSSITQRQLTLSNGCRISAYPTGDSGYTIRGLTADVLIIEEAPYIRNSIVNQVLLPMVAATDGKVIKIGTPFGMNHFHRSAMDEDSGYAVHINDYTRALEVGHFSDDFIEDVRRSCSDMEFRTEYGAEFIADEDAYFSYELIENCISDLPSLKQPQEGMSYYLGADLARLGTDSSVLVIVEQGSETLPHKVVNIIEIKQNKLDEVIELIYGLHEKWNFVKIYLDETGLGAGVSDVLARKLNRSQVNRSVSSYKRNFDVMDVIVGVTFSQRTKMDIFSNLKMLMEQGRLAIPNHNKLIFQLKDFRYELSEKSGKLSLHHAEGGNDDFCDAIALAVRGLNTGGVAFDFG